MNELLQMLSLRWEHLLGRASGPLHFRFLMMPTVVTILAIRAGLRDARESQSGFVWMFLTRRSERGGLLRSALRDIWRILIVALVLDTAYQVIVFKTLYPGEALIVAVVCAVIPYIVFRGPVSVLIRLFRNRASGAAESET
jgi:hypothetical protein